MALQSLVFGLVFQVNLPGEALFPVTPPVMPFVPIPVSPTVACLAGNWLSFTNLGFWNCTVFRQDQATFTLSARQYNLYVI
jgi:hypothetical protein